ncbi:unnamed protein product [Brachionus calyciflorus]|uniref:Uncharacterized protein n=1 Tax=Brachionus calyciflorus TaxID=104777 RepID=A0A814PVC3_9BILA|nr:unnamed protein product [Brachionus calyciflorus]
MSFNERILFLISENVNDIKTTITSYNSDALKNQKESFDSHKEYIQIQNEPLNRQKEVNSYSSRNSRDSVISKDQNAINNSRNLSDEEPLGNRDSNQNKPIKGISQIADSNRPQLAKS